jgi:hypothetical protein
MLIRIGLLLLALTYAAPGFAFEAQLTFRGVYSCTPGQGITGDTSTFIIDTNRRVKLLQAVYSIPGGQIFPTGLFEYQGRFDVRARTFTFTSAAVVGENHFWAPAILPNRYELSRDGETLTRFILNPGCTVSPYTRLRVLTPTPGPVSPPLRVRPGGQG